MESPIYLDNQATTPLDPLVLDAMLPYFTDTYGNPHSSEHIFGWQALSALENARQEVADLIGAERSNIIFTSGATESVSIAISGLTRSCEVQCRNKVITVATEHACVLESCKHAKKAGYEVIVLPVMENGILDLDILRENLDEQTLLVSVMIANNEIGVIQPVEEIAKMCREVGSLFHTDATQAVGKIPVDVESLGIDLLSASAHKLYGPKGVGILYIRDGVEQLLTSLTHGGKQERGLRPGTVALPLAVGFGAAANLAENYMGFESMRIKDLRDTMLNRLQEAIPDVKVLGDLEKRLPGNLAMIFPNISGSKLINKLGNCIAMSTGSACSSTSSTPSHVVKALGVGDIKARAALRVSIGRFNTDIEINKTVDLLLSKINRR